MARRSSKVAASRTGKVSPNSAAAELTKLVQAFTYRPYPSVSRLTNIVFWAGAGFSKAWEPTSPLGSELFTIDGDSLGPLSLFATLADHFGSDGQLSYDQFRQLTYQLDMYERYPDLRSRYFDPQNIAMSRNELRRAVVAKFNSISRLNHLHKNQLKFPLPRPTKAQQDILAFFNYLRTRSSGADGITEGVRAQFITTNYDYVIETILDNIIPDPNDSLFLYTYRGITPTSVAHHRNPEPLHNHWLVDHLLKLNGGFEILVDGAGYVLDYTKRPAAEIEKAPPVLILPSREQQYTDPYFQAMFPKAIRVMREGTILVLIGYSLPEDDALIRFIIRQFAEAKEDGVGKYIFYIDLLENCQKFQKLQQVFPWVEHPNLGLDFPKIHLYEGGFAKFAKECVRLIPR